MVPVRQSKGRAGTAHRSSERGEHTRAILRRLRRSYSGATRSGLTKRTVRWPGCVVPPTVHLRCIVVGVVIALVRTLPLLPRGDTVVFPKMMAQLMVRSERSRPDGESEIVGHARPLERGHPFQLRGSTLRGGIVPAARGQCSVQIEKVAAWHGMAIIPAALRSGREPFAALPRCLFMPNRSKPRPARTAARTAGLAYVNDEEHGEAHSTLWAGREGGDPKGRRLE